MKSKVVTREEALSRIHDGQTIMFGDWHGEFAADEIIDGMLEKGIKDIDAIAVSAGMADQGVGKLIKDHRVKSLITTHIGLNPIAKDQMFAGELAIEFSPQGTFAERIRCGGAGLGGCLTPTGLGTEVEEGKQKLTINGKEYLLELPLRADVALIKATSARNGNSRRYSLPLIVSFCLPSSTSVPSPVGVKQPPKPAPPQRILSAKVPCGLNSIASSPANI